MASPRYFMVKGIKMVSWLSVFSTTLLLHILPFWAGFPLSSSWWAIGAGVWLSLFSIDLWECLHPYLAVVCNSLPISGSLDVVNYVGATVNSAIAKRISIIQFCQTEV